MTRSHLPETAAATPAPATEPNPRPGLVLTEPRTPQGQLVLSAEALDFVARLERRFGTRIDDCLRARRAVQARIDAGEYPHFPAETAEVRESQWSVAPIPTDLLDRRVEITGPVDAKTIINALNSSARCFMADFEDSTSPTWENVIGGQENLRLAVRGALVHIDEERGKTYRLGAKRATLLVRPRGLHLPEKHVLLDGRPVHGALFDFGLFLFHNAKLLVERGSGAYFYLPKLEHYLEARLWNDVFVLAEHDLGLAPGTIRATVLIETITAAFQMDEILWELRDHCVGLNCGRWDYIFSVIKRFQAHPDFVLPDRGAIGMERHFLRAYSRRLIRTCHRRDALAMGGMAAQIPLKDDPVGTERALAKVRADKQREALDGHDGTWVAHPGLIAVAQAEFDAVLRGSNQLDVERVVPRSTWRDLLAVPDGAATIEGLRNDLDVSLRYLEAWLRGQGCVAIHGLMEDAATAEIARAQVWQWRVHGKHLADGRLVSAELVESTLQECAEALRAEVGAEAYEAGRYALAERLLRDLVLGDECAEFLTTIAYRYL
jgi:malate synthase